MTTRVDYVLRDGSRGTWDEAATNSPQQYLAELDYINRKLDGKLKQLIFVEITETDIATLPYQRKAK